MEEIQAAATAFVEAREALTDGTAE